MATNQAELDIVIKAIDQASSELKKIASNTGDAMGQVKNASDQAKQSNDALATSVFEGVAAWDTLKKGVSIVSDFIKDSIGEFAQASETMAEVKVNVQNAGYSYDEIQPKMEAYAEAGLKMGFQNEETSASLSKLLLITNDYSQAQALTNLAMDLARNKGISLEQATTSLAQVIQGAGARALMQYGLSFKTGATAAEVLTELQDKLKGSTEAFANSTGGQLEIMQTQWNELKQKVGEQFAPALAAAFSLFEDHLPDILRTIQELTSDFFEVANAVQAFGDETGVFIGIEEALKATLGYVKLVSDAIGALGDGIRALQGTQQEYANSNEEVSDGIKKIIDEWNQLHPKVQVSIDDWKQYDVSMQTAIIRSVGAAEKQGKLKDSVDATSNALAHVGENTAKAQVELMKHSDVVQKLGETYAKMKNDAVTDLSTMADAFSAKMKTIQDSIAATTKSITDLTASYNSTKLSDTQSVADQIVASEQKIKDIKTQLSQATTDQERIQLQAQLADEQKNYDTSLAFRTANSQAIADAETKAGKTDLQRAIDDYNAKRQLADKEYQDKLTSLKNQLQAENTQAAAEIKLTTDKLTQTKKLIDAANIEYQKQANARVGMTAAEVNQEIAYYNALAAAISKVQSATASAVPTINGPSVPHFASGGIVNGPTLALVGEAGPEAIIPLSLLGGGGAGSLSGAGGGIQVVIQGGTFYTDRQSVVDMANSIAKIIVQQIKVRNYAS